jgi:hypothetical protein
MFLHIGTLLWMPRMFFQLGLKTTCTFVAHIFAKIVNMITLCIWLSLVNELNILVKISINSLHATCIFVCVCACARVRAQLQICFTHYRNVQRRSNIVKIHNRYNLLCKYQCDQIPSLIWSLYKLKRNKITSIHLTEYELTNIWNLNHEQNLWRGKTWINAESIILTVHSSFTTSLLCWAIFVGNTIIALHSVIIILLIWCIHITDNHFYLQLLEETVQVILTAANLKTHSVTQHYAPGSAVDAKIVLFLLQITLSAFHVRF